MATSPFPFGFSPAAANAQSHVYSPIPSHHHPLPPPFPSYHYAAAYPPPPPGFVPAPMYAPTPVFPPPPFCFEAPPYSPHPSPLPFFGAPHWPPPASELPLASNYPPTEAAAPPTSASPANHSSSSQDLHASPGHPIHYPFPAAATFHYPPTESAAPPTAAPPTTGAPSLSATPETTLLRYPDQVPSAPLTSSLCQGGSLTEGNGTGGASISNEKFVQGQAHHEQQQACAQTSFDAIQGQLAKISSMLSRFAVSHGKQSSSAHTSKPEQLHHISVVPATPASSPLGVTTTTPIAPKVFDTMPTPSSGCLKMFGKQSSAAEDGTEHSYYMLPEDYPLERAVPEPVFAVYDDKLHSCSNESDHVFSSNPRQQPHEHTDFSESLEKLVSEQLPKCFNKPIFSQERPTVGTAGVFSLTNEQSVCDLEKLTGGENLSFAKQDKEQLLNCFSKASAFPNVLDVYVRRIGQEESQGDENLLWEKYVCRSATRHSISIFPWDPGASTPLHSSNFSTSIQQLTDPSWNVTGVPERRKEWDPGDTQFQVLFTAAAGTTKMQCTDACTSVMLQVLDVQFNAKRALISESDVLCYLAYGLRWTELNAAVLLVLAVKCSPGKAKLQWDPGIAISSYIWLNILTGCSALDKQLPCTHITVVAAETNHSYLKLFMHSVCRATTRQVAEQRHLLEPSFKVVMLLNGLRFTEGQPAYMSWDPGILGILDMMLVMGNQSVVTASGSSNIEGITSSTRTRCFIIHQLEFVHQQPINENFKTKCLLLSSKKGIQIWDIDTFFTTFLPP